MKITVKTLQQKTFHVEADPSEKISELKQKIEASQGFPIANQKLIHSGKILSDDITIAKYNISEKDFLVVMVTKPKSAAPPAPQPVQEQAPTTTTEQTPTPPAPGPIAEISTQPSPVQTPASTAIDMSSLATGEEFESAVTSLMEMGYERSEVIRAMRAAFNNPDRAAEYLMTGIPDHVAREFAPQQPTPTRPTTQQQPQSAQPATSEYINLFNAAQQQAVSQRAAPTPGSGAEALAGLRNAPQFQQLRQLVQAQPQLLEPMLHSLGQSNPQLLQLINQNQDAFLELLNEGDDDDLDAMGGVGPGQTVISITPEENEAIQRLVALGFDRDAAVVAYLACDKNEELAANYLFDHEMGDDE